MNRRVGSYRPPRGSMRLDGRAIASLLQAPDGRFYVAVESGTTVLLTAEQLRDRVEVTIAEPL